MERGPRSDAAALPIHVTDDGQILVHVGSRFVEASMDDLDRMLERVGADGGSVRYSRDDLAAEPTDTALAVMDLMTEYGVEVEVAAEPPRELDDLRP